MKESIRLVGSLSGRTDTVDRVLRISIATEFLTTEQCPGNDGACGKRE